MVLLTGFTDGKYFRKGARLQWFEPDNIKQVVFCPASVMIVDKLVKEPKMVWAGAFEEYGYTNPITDPSVLKFRVIEPPHKLK